MSIWDKIFGKLKLFFKFLNRTNSPSTSIKVKNSNIDGDVVGRDKIINERAKDLKSFEFFLENSEWRKEFIDHQEVWVCESDNTYQIVIGYEYRDFVEDFTRVYPDKNAQAYSVYLKIGEVKIKDILFVSCDGGRILIPVPTPINIDDKIIWRYYKNFLEYKVAKIAGVFGDYNTIESVARRSGIEIV